MIVLPLLTPDCHRRQAHTLMRLSETTSDPDTAAALLTLAADHAKLAEENQSATLRQQLLQPKNG